MAKQRKRFLSSTIFRYAVLFACALVALQVGIIYTTTHYSQSVMQDQADQHVYRILSLCVDEVEKNTEVADRTLKYILTQDSYLRLLGSQRTNVPYHAYYALSRDIDLSCFSDNPGKTYVLANLSGDVLLEKRSASFSYDQLSLLETYLAAIGEAGLCEDSGWYLDVIGIRHYLIRHYISNGVIVMALLDLENMWTNYLSMLGSGGMWVSGGGISFGLGSDASSGRLIEAKMEGVDLTLTAYSADEWKPFANILPVLIVAFCLIAVLFLAFFVSYMNLEFNKPIADLERVTHRIEQGDYQCRASLKCRNDELQNLGSSLNSMLDMIMRLKIEQYEQIIRAQDAELKYYYMQIRPHFYLNALASMHGMCQRGENKRISDYILALSKNIRYMFTAGFRRVPLREETEHIDDYIRCQEIMLPDCVFSYIDVTAEAGGWMIPQMLLHTFVENVYKHVVTLGRVVTLLVKAEVVEEPAVSEEPILKMIVEDDGEGFPQEILDAFEDPEDSETLKSCIGLLNARRTLELMYGRTDLMRLKNNQSAGSRIVVYIPRDTVPERRNLDETADRG